MQQLLYKWQVAIVSKLDKKQGSQVVRGSGLLISSDLVLTAAHNLYYNMQQIDTKRVNLYPGQLGQLKRPYKIEEVYIPKEFKENPKISNTFYDYALIKLSETYKAEGKQEFIPLSHNFKKAIEVAKLAIYGYPDINYSNIGEEEAIDTTFQSGFGDKDRFVEIDKHEQMLHTVSTLPGHSGSPIILIDQNNKHFKYRVVGIHKGTITFQDKENRKYNVGRIISFDLIEQLKQKAIDFGA